MQIEKSNEFGRLSELELNDFEKANEIVLPGDYRVFLLNHNGGKPVPNKIENPKTVISYLLGMHNGHYYASLYKHIDMFMSRLPFSTIPIATDPFGNLFIMSVHPEGFGHIYFWNHEMEPEVQDGHYIENCSFISYNFTDFINSFY